MRAKKNLLVGDGLEGRLFMGREVSYARRCQNYLVAEGDPMIFRNVGISPLGRPRVIRKSNRGNTHS